MALNVGDRIDAIKEIGSAPSPGWCQIPDKMEKKTYNSQEFLILPYAPGGINFTGTTGLDVLSGPFSGCWMARYKLKGAYNVCHVATPECNTKWAELKQSGEITEVTEFKPANALMELAGSGFKFTSGPQTYGLVTSTGQFQSLLCYPNGKVLTVFRIAVMKPVQR